MVQQVENPHCRLPAKTLFIGVPLIARLARRPTIAYQQIPS
jgi:hypothetical protein